MADLVDSELTVRAIKKLNPNCVVSVQDGEIITYSIMVQNDAGESVEQPQFTIEEIRAKYPEVETEMAKERIQATRRVAYGTWQEQLDMQFHDAKDGTTTWQDHVQAVKDANSF